MSSIIESCCTFLCEGEPGSAKHLETIKLVEHKVKESGIQLVLSL
jgi:hypothetical protein